MDNNGWRPIKTHDGNRTDNVLVFCEDSKRQFVAHRFFDDISFRYGDGNLIGRDLLCRPQWWKPLDEKPTAEDNNGWRPIKTLDRNRTDYILVFKESSNCQFVAQPLRDDWFRYGAHNGANLACRPEWWKPLHKEPTVEPIHMDNGWRRIETYDRDLPDSVLVFCEDSRSQLVAYRLSDNLFCYGAHNGTNLVCRPQWWKPLDKGPIE
jgi:hypothetical protein